MEIQSRLFELQDKAYAEFQSRLTPNIPRELFIGVRVPEARSLAKKYMKEDESEIFLNSLPHHYYDENILHALLISEIKDYENCVEKIEIFLPYVDNWAVCDIISPKVFKKHKPELLERIKVWALSEHSYTCRFGLEMLMSHFLDESFKPEYLEIPAAVESEEYYVKMMIAWFFATALAKQWGDSIVYLENNRLDVWSHNKTVQKACESYRIKDEQKLYLKKLKR
ncbi:MAG: DNA alkylation repair protein [Anaerovoracaceae bacterium]